MSFDRRLLCLLIGVACSSSCASDVSPPHELGVRTRALEHECGSGEADVTGDVTAILRSSEPLDPSQPQVYGSEACGGVVFHYDNPDEEGLRGAWIQASASGDVVGPSRCENRRLEADYWGYEDREWTKLATVASAAVFEPGAGSGAGYCRLEGLIEHEAAFSKLRIVARVIEGSETYPMYACVW